MFAAFLSVFTTSAFDVIYIIFFSLLILRPHCETDWNSWCSLLLNQRVFKREKVLKQILGASISHELYDTLLLLSEIEHFGTISLRTIDIIHYFTTTIVDHDTSTTCNAPYAAVNTYFTLYRQAYIAVTSVYLALVKYGYRSDVKPKAVNAYVMLTSRYSQYVYSINSSLLEREDFLFSKIYQ